MIRDGLVHARHTGLEGVFVLGDPAYYERFGFLAKPASGFTSPYVGPHLMVLALNGTMPVSTGIVEYAPAFGALD